MSMTKKLWSVNALATELEYDRRTIAKRLTGVPPDGEVGGHPAYHLDTALSVLNVKKAPPRARVALGDPLLEVVADRLENWRQIRFDSCEDGTGSDPTAATIAQVARAHRVEPKNVLAWLRSGCPYLVEGDWETGEGFVLRYHWAAEWAMSVAMRLAQCEDEAIRRGLGMYRGAFAQAAEA